ncbi:PREDICTED: CD151 antigen-like isoform X2 [Priapulus caudatus]|nr:PREDICTED: CD151 antigen-like isoform X2 [Priapulus caudatus]XP_014671109.1 PREDICTED: CD151 antigen-like isoform X2 [Priapulus caudatus]XP_014671110.1 PREDICTED: CD151 antigen-like isoform X2 [Priapulus caudatus]XP_014671112.1 PREDICTED: CD151 antigen-like isoform X2 [Priapulus caudatus]
MTDLSCGATCSKYLLFVFNFLFFTAGVAALAIGIWVLVDKSSFYDLTKLTDDVNELDAPGVLEIAAYLFIVAGAVTLIIAFLGCCGAVTEWRPLLVTYAVFLVIILVLEVAAGITVAVFRGKVDESLKAFMLTTLNTEYTGESNHRFTDAWDAMQYSFQCCGVDSGADWQKDAVTAWKMKSEWKIPPTCCKVQDTSALFGEELVNTLEKLSCKTLGDSLTSNYDKGCYQALENWIAEHATICIGIGIGLGLLQMFGIIFACLLCNAIAKSGSQAV